MLAQVINVRVTFIYNKVLFQHHIFTFTQEWLWGSLYNPTDKCSEWKKNNVYLQNIGKWKNKVAENGTTQGKYKPQNHKSTSKVV